MRTTKILVTILASWSALPIASHADPFVAEFTFDAGCSIFGHPPVPQRDGFDYCFTEVAVDSSVIGEGVSINSIQASVFGDNKGDVINFDWEIYLGSSSFGLPEGQFIDTLIDPVTGYTRNAPTILHTVIGEQFDTNDYTFSINHDFNTNATSGSPYLSAIRSAFTSPVDTTDGLYAQMFFWTADNRNSSIDFGEVTLTVHGDIQVVPEPGTLALFAIGLAGIGLARRRKRLA